MRQSYWSILLTVASFFLALIEGEVKTLSLSFFSFLAAISIAITSSQLFSRWLGSSAKMFDCDNCFSWRKAREMKRNCWKVWFLVHRRDSSQRWNKTFEENDSILSSWQFAWVRKCTLQSCSFSKNCFVNQRNFNDDTLSLLQELMADFHSC